MVVGALGPATPSGGGLSGIIGVYGSIAAASRHRECKHQNLQEHGYNLTCLFHFSPPGLYIFSRFFLSASKKDYPFLSDTSIITHYFDNFNCKMYKASLHFLHFYTIKAYKNPDFGKSGVFKSLYQAHDVSKSGALRGSYSSFLSSELAAASACAVLSISTILKVLDEVLTTRLTKPRSISPTVPS